MAGRIVTGRLAQEWLRHPLADVLLAAHASGAQLVDG
jgi:hypothetical protein